jgi:hypothetical protein
MSNATRWYSTRKLVKAAVGISGADLDSLIESYIEVASEDIEKFLGRRFIPETAVKSFRWPPRIGGGTILRLEDLDLLAVTQLQTKAQDATPTTIDAADYFLEPVNSGPPYSRVEIDLSSNAAFESGDTPQRSIAITGRWGYGEDTKTAGAVESGLAADAAATTFECSDSSLIEVGDTLLIEDEQLFVTGKAPTLLADSNATLLFAITADLTDNVLTLSAIPAPYMFAGEVIQIDSELMLIEVAAAIAVTVKRAYDGTLLATHATDADSVKPFRLLTVVRGVNGTTAAVHADDTAISKYAPPADVMEYCRAQAIALHQQGRSGWTGVIGDSEGGQIETKMFALWSMKQNLIAKYRPVTL